MGRAAGLLGALAVLATARAGADVSGYVASQLLFADKSSTAPLGILVPGPPAWWAYLELNLQPRLRAGGRFSLAGDASLYLATRGPAPLLLLNEGHASLQLGPVNLLAGRRRVIWGSGLAANPTDLVNPPKLLLDPQRQRTGAFLLPLIEWTSEWVTVSAFLNPRLETDRLALPRSLDPEAGIAGARIYALVASTDVTLMGFRDLGADRSYLGASMSRFVGESLEVHAEGMISQDVPAPVPFLQPGCSARADPSSRLRGSLIAGLRHDWSDQTFLSLEYLHEARGLSAADRELLPAAVACSVEHATQVPRQPAPNPVGYPIEPPLALLREHYAVIMFQRPHLAGGAWEDVGVSALLLWGPVDTSLIWQARITWKVVEQATLGFGYLLSDSVAQDGELRMWPTRVVLFLDTRISF